MKHTSGVTDITGACLHSLALNRFPATTGFSLKATESSTEGLKVSGMTGEGRRAALDRDASRADVSIWAAISVIELENMEVVDLGAREMYMMCLLA